MMTTEKLEKFTEWLKENDVVDNRSQEYINESISNVASDISKHYTDVSKIDGKALRTLTESRSKPVVTKDGIWYVQSVDGFVGKGYDFVELTKMSKGLRHVITVDSENFGKLTDYLETELKSKALKAVLSNLMKDHSVIDGVEIKIREEDIKAGSLINDFLQPYALIMHTKRFTKVLALPINNRAGVNKADFIKILVNGQYEWATDKEIRSPRDFENPKKVKVDIFEVLNQLIERNGKIHNLSFWNNACVRMDGSGSDSWSFKLEDANLKIHPDWVGKIV